MLNFLNSSVIYVSQQNGSDWEYSGFSPVEDKTGAGPLKTLDRALEMIYKMRCSGNMQSMTVKIIGDYYVTNPICIGSNYYSSTLNPNTETYGITFSGYDNKARIIGGKKISNFKRDKFNGTECLSAFIPEVKSGKWEFTDLYVNGERAILTRYPEKGTLRAVMTATPKCNVNDSEINESSDWFVAYKEDLENISGIDDAIVSFYHWWVDEHSPIKSFDKHSNKITMKYIPRKRISVEYEKNDTSNFEYYLENIPEMFKNSGEWYLEKASGKIYYIPKNGQNSENIEVFAPVTDKLICVIGKIDNKVTSINFENLEIICSRGDYCSVDENNPDVVYASDKQSVCSAYGAVIFENAVNCEINNCAIGCVGLHGIELLSGCSDIRIENCSLHDIGAGGIKILGDTGENAELHTHHIFIKNNVIKNCSKRYAAGCGILANHTYCNEISSNEICYLDYSGISVGWVWGYKDSKTYGNLIKNNHIHHIGMGRLSDMGGIYLLGKQRGTVVDGNVIHDVNSNHYGGNGIYADEGTSYVTFKNNVVYNAKSVAYNQHYGTYNVIKNNIFAFGDEAVIQVYNKDNTNIGTLIENNVLVSNGTAIYHFEPFNKYPSSGMNSNSNVIWDISGKEPIIYDNGNKKYNLKNWQATFLRDENSKIENPNYVDPLNGNFCEED